MNNEVALWCSVGFKEKSAMKAAAAFFHRPALPSVDLRKMSTDEWKSHAAEIRKMLHEEKTTKKPIIGPGPNPAAPNPMNGIEMNEVAETFLA